MTKQDSGLTPMIFAVMEKGMMRMPDKYDFACMVDDIFKECKTMSDVNFRFIEMQNALTHLFNQNIELKVAEDKERKLRG